MANQYISFKDCLASNSSHAKRKHPGTQGDVIADKIFLACRGLYLTRYGQLFQCCIVSYSAIPTGQFSSGAGGQFSIGANTASKQSLMFEHI